ncbi:protein VASCULAR ASSOCIATED DEATH 1, chloroplastic [Phalaenopsis equestris]|uniref:protein VASCULAR ASSOCIATED DEATH 1, chloroplastic n=1 Tax=Phalaenopsis equestris TaxID=78828 RepID=UPI0009E2C3E9|nr:protein VASCULAR ASSOCIATED DEATH 1, chloroplastic [Phalaenopsis equestris]
MAVEPPSMEKMESSCSDALQSSRSLPSRLGKLDGDAASETSSIHSLENSERKEADVSVSSARSEEYRLLFRLPPDEVLVQDFNCALQENILLQGHMYLFVHHICFYSNIFGFETKKTIPFHEVTCVRKAKTAAIFPNAIEIAAGVKKHFFGSFLSRDEAYKLIVDGWAQHAGDARFILEDLKAETSIEDIANAIAERERGAKQFADDLPSSCRNSDANFEECMLLSNGKTDATLLENKEEESNNREENTESHSGHVSLQCEDIDAPKVPENFTNCCPGKVSGSVRLKHVCVEEFFNIFFSDQAYNFVECFHKKCGDKDFQCTSWRRHEQFGYIRDLSFLHPIKLYLGAKYGRCQEAQKFRVYRKSHLVIETLQQIADVPYADYFLVEGIWEVQQNGNEENGCTVRVYSKVSFSKKTIFRGKIEQSTREECREVYGIWIQNAHELFKKKVGKQEDIYTVQGSDVRSQISELVETSELLPQASSADMQQTLPHPENFEPLIENAVQEHSTSLNFGSSVIKETWVASMSYLKSDSYLPLVLGVIGLVAVLILMQVSIIVLLSRVPEVHLVTQGSSIGELGNYRKENLEWLDKRFYYLKEEMSMVEARLEAMRNEHAILKMHLQNLERVKHKARK